MKHEVWERCASSVLLLRCYDMQEVDMKMTCFVLYNEVLFVSLFIMAGGGWETCAPQVLLLRCRVLKKVGIGMNDIGL